MRTTVIGWLLVLAVALTGIGLVLHDLAVQDQHQQELRALLTTGRDASAVTAAANARELRLLVSLQSFDHAQSVENQKDLQTAIVAVEKHLDQTIIRTVGALEKSSR